MDNPTTTVSVVCRLCKGEQRISAPVTAFLAWENGAFAQDALPMLSADDREMLISQTCGDCWADMFGEPEDEFQENWENN